MNLRKGHLVRHKWDARRHGRILSANVNDPAHLGMVVVAWLPDGYPTAMRPVDLVLDDHPLRGRDVVREHSIDSWQDLL